MTDWTPQYAFTKRFWAGCAVLFMSAVFITVTLLAANDAHRLSANNAQTQATVLDTRFIAPTSARDGDGSHFVTYTFTWNDTVITNERGVPKDFFDTHPTGTEWPIRVHPNAPRIHDLYTGETRSTAWGHLLISILTAVFGLWFGLSNGNLAALRARLASNSR